MSKEFEQARELFLAGVAAYEAGDAALAERHCLASLALVPGRTSTLCNLAAARLKLGRPAEALADLDRVLAAAPEDAQAWCLRGQAQEQLAQAEAALASYRRAQQIEPALALCWLRAGLLLNALQRHAEALQAFERLAQIHPEDAEAWFRQGQALQHLGRHDESLGLYDKALALDPGHAQAWGNRGGVLKGQRRFDEAAQAYERALALGADPELMNFYLAAMRHARGGGVADAAPSAAPRPYVQALFDDYAASFEHHLVEVLQYRGHERLVQGLADLKAGRHGAVLDLGCGTGLCATLLRERADLIDGVDISPRMLEQARARGLYRHLNQGDLVEHMQGCAERYELVLAADVLIYFGDLAPVFAAVARVLKAGGVFCFSVEAAAGEGDEGGRGFELRSSMRYAHALRYLRELAQTGGFDWLQALAGVIRHDQREPIQGHYVYLRRR